MITRDNGRTFDQVTRFDTRSEAFWLADRLTASVAPKRKFWVPGDPLDQGAEGACTAFGVAGDLICSPTRVNRIGDRPVDNAFAFEGYQWIKRNDEWPGENYSGSSVNAAMKWYRDELKAIDGWLWCRSVEELIQAVLQVGPAVIGIPWWDSMYEPRGDDGYVQVGGRVVGGHCILVNGYSPNYGKLGEVFRLRNSWGESWGKNGHGYIRLDAFDSLAFHGAGEVAIPVGRRMPTKRELELAA